jgi:hypothetical protein
LPRDNASETNKLRTLWLIGDSVTAQMGAEAFCRIAQELSEELSEVFSEERITLDDFLNLLGEELMLPVEEDSFAPRSCAMQMRTAGGECGTEEPASAANQRRGKRCLA